MKKQHHNIIVLKFLKYYNEYKLEVAKFVCTNFMKKLLQNVSNFFTLSSQISKQNTRFSRQKNKSLYMYIFLYHISCLQKCIKNRGVKVWNNISIKIQKHLLIHFKKSLKNFIDKL